MTNNAMLWDALLPFKATPCRFSGRVLARAKVLSLPLSWLNKSGESDGAVIVLRAAASAGRGTWKSAGFPSPTTIANFLSQG